MARKNKLIKTSENNIYQVEMEDGSIDFIAKFTHNGTRYSEKNLTVKYGVTKVSQAAKKLMEIRVDLSRGIDVFGKSSNTINSLVEEYLNARSVSYRYNNTYFYKKYISPIIGHLKIDKVTKDHIKKIIKNMEKEALSISTIRKVKVLLNPIFREAYNDEVINRNILGSFSFSKGTGKPDLTDRLDEPLIDAIRKIYNQAVSRDDDYALMFLVSIMCARRFGEILQIQHRDIKDGIVNVRAGTTKTHKGKAHFDATVEQYPLPKEVLDRLEIKENSTEKVFTHDYRTYLDKYAEMIDDECDLKLKPLSKEYPIRSHENRNFIMSIQGRESGRDNVGILCLSHSDSSNMNQLYNSVELYEVIDVYNKYWTKLRLK
ncbi:MAG: hypothetical protein WBF48_12755 [Halarcobacter sp.]